eukprot:scpid22168/ scgid8902/ 
MSFFPSAGSRFSVSSLLKYLSLLSEYNYILLQLWQQQAHATVENVVLFLLDLEKIRFLCNTNLILCIHELLFFFLRHNFLLSFICTSACPHTCTHTHMYTDTHNYSNSREK